MLPNVHEPVDEAAKLASNQSFDYLYGPNAEAYWRSVCPLLHINDRKYQGT